MSTFSIHNLVTDEILEASGLGAEATDLLDSVLTFLGPVFGRNIAWDVFPDELEPEEDEEPDFIDYDLECGFDPYEGCYSFDC